MALVAGAIALLAAGAATVSVKAIHGQQNNEWQLGEINGQLLFKPPYRVVILPTKSAERKQGRNFPVSMFAADGRALGINFSAEDMLRWAYSPDGGTAEFSATRTVIDTELLTNRYDFLSNLPNGSRLAFQHEIRRKFGLVGKFETINTNILVLETRFPDRDLSPSERKESSVGSLNTGNGWISGTNATMDQLAKALENYLATPVINETGLKRNFDFGFGWDDVTEGHSGVKQALINQVGLELVPTNMPIEMLVIEKAK